MWIKTGIFIPERLGLGLKLACSHDLAGADALLPQMAAELLVDKAFDADKRVSEPLAAAGKSAIIPPRGRGSPPIRSVRSVTQ